MTDYGTIKIPEAEYDRHNQRRKQMGLSWAAYIDGEAPETEAFARELVDAVAVEADGQGRVDSDDLADAVARKLDYGQLATAVADELEGRMR